MNTIYCAILFCLLFLVGIDQVLKKKTPNNTAFLTIWPHLWLAGKNTDT